ncbi:MAG: amidohydrolase [Bacteroidetes bacterium]|nr:amidohydrolase [Bacteroidota bacterium]
MSTLHFTLLQSPLHWENPNENLKMFTSKIESIEGKKEVLVLPEMFTTGFSMQAAALAENMDGKSIRWMKQMAMEHKIILTGSLIIEEAGKYFNRLIWMQPDGNFGYYDKRHLFSYAGEDVEFTPGTKRLITQVKGIRILTLICYDLRFPVWSRQHQADEYDVILYVANWPVKRVHAWKTLLQARAIENQCYVIGMNRTGEDGNGHQYSGESCIIDPLGEILTRSNAMHDILNYEIDQQNVSSLRSTLPFQKDKDDFHML